MLQKKVIRIIAGVQKYDHAQKLFSELKIMKFMDINKYIIGKLMFKVNNGSVDDIFPNYFVKNLDFHSYNTRQSHEYSTPRSRIKIGQKQFRYQGAVIWNKLLKLDITTDCSEQVFALHLKKIILMEDS